MSRAALPQKYLKSTGTQIADFEDYANWIAAWGSKAEDPDHFLTGTKSIKIYRSTGSTGLYKTWATPVPISDVGIIMLGVYLHTDLVTTVGQMELGISNLDSDSNRIKCAIVGANGTRSILRQGMWMYLLFHASDFVAEGSGVSWATIYANGIKRIRITISTQTADTETAISLDDLRISTQGLPRLCIGFDDGYLNDIGGLTACDYMNARGIIGTQYVISSRVGLPGDHLSLAQLQALYAQGWAISNHTATHDSWVAGELTQAQYEAEISTCTDYLVANGMPRAAHHFAYPGGLYNASMAAAIISQNIITGRKALDFYQYLLPAGSNLYCLNARLCGRLIALATIKGWIDRAMQIGTSLFLVFHGIVTTPTLDTQTSIANFCALIDYVAAKKIPCVTIDEWYNGMTDPRYKSALLNRA